MPKLRVLSGREVCALRVLHGFMEVRRKGSHISMQRKDAATTITIIIGSAYSGVAQVNGGSSASGGNSKQDQQRESDVITDPTTADKVKCA